MRFKVAFHMTETRFQPSFHATDTQFHPCFAALQKMTEIKDADPYTGDYTVTPKVEAQTLPTAKKLMADDLTVLGVPIYEVSNNSGGSTVYIAKEMD